MSIIVIPAGPLAELWYFRDYWKPETFNGLTYGLEDALFAFTIGGIGAVLYEEVLNRQLFRKYRPEKSWELLLFPLIIALSFIILSGQFAINSIYASFIGLSLCALFIVIKRHDLVKVALLNGVFLVLAAIPVYLIVLQIYPELIQRYWFVHNLSGISILGVPVEELAWYFFWGITIGPFYEFAKGLGDRRIPKSRYNKKQHV